MIIKNGLVFTPQGFEKRDIQIDASHRIAAQISPSDMDIFDAVGCYVVPGFIDIHTHGAVGADFCDADPEGLSRIAAYFKSCGITSFCPTSMTLPEERLKKIFASASRMIEAQSNKDVKTQAKVVGINMEGPFIATSKKGAQKADYIRNPDNAMFFRLFHGCQDQIKFVTLAPELPGSLEFIDAVKNFVSVSLGHSACNYDTAKDAFSHGANHTTHLFNAMEPLFHRNPGIPGAAADACAASSDNFIELICDGIHIHPSMVRNAFRLFGEDHVILISDSMRACGMEDGTYELGGQDVHKHGFHATLADGTLAGSVTNLFVCFKNAVSFGVPLHAALKAVTINPAKSLHMENEIGQLSPGMAGDVLVLSRDLELLKLF